MASSISIGSTIRKDLESPNKTHFPKTDKQRHFQIARERERKDMRAGNQRRRQRRTAVEEERIERERERDDQLQIYFFQFYIKNNSRFDTNRKILLP